MKTIPVEHEISETWRQHIAEVQESLAGIAQRIAIHKASILELQQEHDWQRRHLGVLVGQLAKEAGLPEPLDPYRLSGDGTKILGTAKIPDEKPIPSAGKEM